MGLFLDPIETIESNKQDTEKLVTTTKQLEKEKKKNTTEYE